MVDKKHGSFNFNIITAHLNIVTYCLKDTVRKHLIAGTNMTRAAVLEYVLLYIVRIKL